MVIAKDFYLRTDVVSVARDLLGKLICTRVNNEVTKGIITEVEAYNGVQDRACHAYGGRLTGRTQVMFEEGGIAYVYLCYGMHHLFNVVVSHPHDPKAILVRSIEPLSGGGVMLMRRKPSGRIDRSLTNGPGKLTKALGINISNNGMALDSEELWIENHLNISDNDIVTTTRIGISYAGEDALLPYRFYIKGNEFVSRY